MKHARCHIPFLALVLLCTSTVEAAIDVAYTVNTNANKTPISKYVYGSNWGGDSDYTIRRSGGNRLTGYNWENNFSNAGSDWYHSSDRYLVRDLPPSQQLIPGIALTTFHDTALSQGQDSIITLQMAGYVSADDYGTVTEAETAPSVRWKKAVSAKGAPFCYPPGSPLTSDANVYMDECVNFLVSKYGHAGEPNGVKFYDLDNEPALWPNTHPRIHPNQTGCVELKDKSVALATAIKNVDPNAQILGPVLYGMSAYLDFQGAPDWSSVKNGYSWFIDYYLDKMEANSATAGKRLLDVLDVHWYPEAQDVNGVRITEFRDYRANWDARMQAPRSLWDYDYHETSWIERWFGSWLPILPPLKDSINIYYPDTNLAITEYAYGGENHYSGGIATADVLGILGKYGVYIATYWGNGTYVDAAIKIYRNYDGAKSTFGDMNVPATMSDKTNSSIYASVFADDPCKLHLIVINKNFDNDINGTFTITNSQNFTSGRVLAFDANSYNITERTPISTITNNSFTYTIPRLSVCHIVLEEPPCQLEYDLTNDCHVNLDDLRVITTVWLENSNCPPEDSACPDLDNSHYIDFFDIALLGQEWRR